jgi:hypothetical protein
LLFPAAQMSVVSPQMLIVTTSHQISIPRCILLAVNFLSNVPGAEIYVTSASRLKDLGRHRLSFDERLAASRFSLWSDECSARAISSSSQVFVVLDPFEARVNGPHEELLSSLKSVKNAFLIASGIDFFRKNARFSDQVRCFFRI